MWCGKWKNRQLYNLLYITEFTQNHALSTLSVPDHARNGKSHTHGTNVSIRSIRIKAPRRSVQLCGSLVGRRPRPFAEVSRADRSRKSGVALPKREICGMAFAIPAIPSPPPMHLGSNSSVFASNSVNSKRD